MREILIIIDVQSSGSSSLYIILMFLVVGEALFEG